MKPLGRRVVVQREATQESYGRIIIPEKYRHQAQVGTVTAVGDAVETVAVGDTVLFGKHSALDVEGYGVYLWEKDLLAVLKRKVEDDDAVQ